MISNYFDTFESPTKTNGVFLMGLFPYLITRSILVEKTKGAKSFVSVAFIAHFGEGVIKSQTSKRWVLTSLVKPCEVGPENETIMSRDECPLYYQDWANLADRNLVDL